MVVCEGFRVTFASNSWDKTDTNKKAVQSEQPFYFEYNSRFLRAYQSLKMHILLYTLSMYVCMNKCMRWAPDSLAFLSRNGLKRFRIAFSQNLFG
jgi:hypothetical protein